MKTVIDAKIIFDQLDTTTTDSEPIYIMAECADGKTLIYRINKVDFISQWNNPDSAYCEVSRLLDQDRYAKHFKYLARYRP